MKAQSICYSTQNFIEPLFHGYPSFEWFSIWYPY